MTHTLRIKVRGYHCDFYGHVNNARYLEFLEEARWGFLEDGLDLAEWKARGLGFVVTEVTIKYRRPAGLNAVLEVRTRTGSLGPRGGVILQDVVLVESGELAASAQITFEVIDLARGKAVPLDGEIAETLGRSLPPADGKDAS